MSDSQAAEVMSRPLAKGWQWIRLGQYVENLDGRRVPVSQREREGRRGGFPYYGASGVIDSIDGHTHDGEFVLIGEDGANLLTRSKPIAFQAKGKIWVNNHAHVLRCKPGYSNAYLAYYINSIDLSPYVTGTAQPKLSQSMMNKIPVPVAPPAQQVEIVAEIEKQFSRLDEAVANLQRVKANLKRYKAAVFKAAVEGRLVETEASIARREGRGYETGEQLLLRILDVRRAKWVGKGKFKEALQPQTGGLPTLPEGWTWARLDSLAALKGGITVDSKRIDPNARSVPYLRVANVQRGVIDLAEVKRINASPKDIEELRLERGDVLFNEGGDRDKLGRGWVWEGQLPDCIHQNHVFRARMYLDAVSPKLISWWGNTFGKDYFLRVGKQTTNLASINLGKLSEFPVPVPPPAEQRRMVQEIERLLSVVEEVEAEVNANLRRAEALRQSVLQSAFSESDRFDASNSVVARTACAQEAASVVIAARVIAQNCEAAAFGRVKLQKLLFLSTHHARIDASNDEYSRLQAGPADLEMLLGVLKRLDQLRWFRERSRERGRRSEGAGYTYERLSLADDYKNHLGAITGDQLKAVDHVCQSLRTWSTEDCELLATVYAAWNDLLLWKYPVSDEAIVEQVHENWHESKRRFSLTRIVDMKSKLTDLGLEPTGFGRPTVGAVADSHSRDLF